MIRIELKEKTLRRPVTLNGILNVDGDVERSLDDDGDGDEVENGLLCFDYELIGIWDLGSLFFD